MEYGFQKFNCQFCQTRPAMVTIRLLSQPQLWQLGSQRVLNGTSLR